MHTYIAIFLAIVNFFKEVMRMENNSTMFKTYNDVVTVKQLAEMLDIGKSLAYKLVKQNTIQSKKIGRQYKIPKNNVINYLNNIN